jgi:hypothetical protein
MQKDFLGIQPTGGNEFDGDWCVGLQVPSTY